MILNDLITDPCVIYIVVRMMVSHNYTDYSNDI